MMNTINTILADDHGIVRSGIKSLLESEGDIRVIAEADNGAEAVQYAQQHAPDLAVIDIRMPVMNGLDAARQIRQTMPQTRVLILSMHDDAEYVLQSVDSGASGYLLKGSSKDEFLKAVRTVHRGEQYFSAEVSHVFVNNYRHARVAPSPVANAEGTYELTKRERQILGMLSEGVNNRDIAEQLNKSVRTIETHRFNIMKKLEVGNVVELLKKVNDEPALRALLSN